MLYLLSKFPSELCTKHMISSENSVNLYTTHNILNICVLTPDCYFQLVNLDIYNYSIPLALVLDLNKIIGQLKLEKNV